MLKPYHAIRVFAMSQVIKRRFTASHYPQSSILIDHETGAKYRIFQAKPQQNLQPRRWYFHQTNREVWCKSHQMTGYLTRQIALSAAQIHAEQQAGLAVAG